MSYFTSTRPATMRVSLWPTIYVIVGVVIAATHNYFVNVNTVQRILSAVLAVLLWPRLVAIDRDARIPQRQLELLRAIPLFAPLPPPTLEHLAHALRRIDVPAGSEVVRVGEPGEDFFIVDSGRAEVLVDGESKRVEPGGYFGEITLLRDVPRTATVRAVTDLALYALARDQFIGAVTGHAASRDAADVVIGERLGALRAGTLPA